METAAVFLEDWGVVDEERTLENVCHRAGQCLRLCACCCLVSHPEGVFPAAGETHSPGRWFLFGWGGLSNGEEGQVEEIPSWSASPWLKTRRAEVSFLEVDSSLAPRAPAGESRGLRLTISKVRVRTPHPTPSYPFISHHKGGRMDLSIHTFLKTPVANNNVSYLTEKTNEKREGMAEPSACWFCRSKVVHDFLLHVVREWPLLGCLLTLSVKRGLLFLCTFSGRGAELRTQSPQLLLTSTDTFGKDTG